MNKILIGLLGVFITIILVVIICAGTTWSHYKTMAFTDNKIETQYINNESMYDNMKKSFLEIAQVNVEKSERFKDIYKGIMEDRYKNDSKVVIKLIQEQNPNFDQSSYDRLITQISADRALFNKQQNYLNDIVREYNNCVISYPITSRLLNFTKKDPSKYNLLSAETKKNFETGESDEIKIFK